MNNEEIIDYAEKEAEFSEKLIDLAENEIEKGNKISSSFFVPEYKLEEKIPYADTLLRIPIWVQMPYYKSLIVPIFPFKSSNAFKNMIGVTPEEFVNLTKRGFVIPVLSTLPKYYVNLDYLDPILSLKPRPPSPMRMSAFYIALNNFDTFNSYVQRSKIFSSNLSSKLPSGFIKNSKLDDIFSDVLGLYTREMARHILELSCLGYNNLIKQYEDSLYKSPNSAPSIFISMATYVPYLVYRYTSALDGILTIDNNIRDLWKGTNLNERNVDFFPGDVGRLLTEELLLAPIKNLGQAEDYYKDYSKARDALYKFDNHIRRKEKNQGLSDEPLLSRAEIIKKTWNETTKSLETWSNDERVLRGLFEEGVRLGTISLGVLGSAAANLPADQSFLVAVLSNYVGDFAKDKLGNILPQAANISARLMRKSHVTTLMDIVDEWPSAKLKLGLKRRE